MSYKAIPGYEGHYKIDISGNVRSIKFGKIKEMKTSLSTRGYKQINLQKEGKASCYFIHQLMGETFLDFKGEEGMLVDHKDNNPLNNNLDNLQVISNRQNISKDAPNKYSKLAGVSFNKGSNRFVSQIRINGKLKYLGLHDTDLEAHQAYLNEYNKLKSKTNE